MIILKPLGEKLDVNHIFEMLYIDFGQIWGNELAAERKLFIQSPRLNSISLHRSQEQYDIDSDPWTQ